MGLTCSGALQAGIIKKRWWAWDQWHVSGRTLAKWTLSEKNLWKDCDFISVYFTLVDISLVSTIVILIMIVLDCMFTVGRSWLLFCVNEDKNVNTSRTHIRTPVSFHHPIFLPQASCLPVLLLPFGECWFTFSLHTFNSQTIQISRHFPTNNKIIKEDLILCQTKPRQKTPFTSHANFFDSVIHDTKEETSSRFNRDLPWSGSLFSSH